VGRREYEVFFGSLFQVLYLILTLTVYENVTDKCMDFVSGA
jgi:hypothetical protein